MWLGVWGGACACRIVLLLHLRMSARLLCREAECLFVLACISQMAQMGNLHPLVGRCRAVHGLTSSCI